jgi:hypothetical protein
MAYDNNINPGNPPLVWSRIKQAFDRVNENFTIIGATVGRVVPQDIETIELSNPVQITTFVDHAFVNGSQATISQTEISQLDGNTYYLKVISSDTVQLYTDEALTTAVDGTAYDPWSSPQAGQIQGLTEFASTDFENLTTNISPNSISTFNLGSQSKPWKALYVGEYSTNDAALLNGVWLGSAQIRGTGGIIDLPLNSTVNGELIINPDNTFFKSVQVDNEERIVADNFVDTLNFLSGDGISMNADSGAESITFTNTGVLSNIAGAGISVSSATGNITIANTGVRSLTSTTALPVGRTEGAGINISSSTGDAVKITNTGVLEIQPGSAAITVFTDEATGIVTITNAAPAGNTVRFVNVDGSIIEANSVAGTLNLVSGYGMSLGVDTLSDTVTFNFDGNGVDIVGSVFADDSTKMVDALANEMYASGGFFGDLTGNVAGNVVGNITGNVTGNVLGNLTGDSTGYHTGDVTGSIFADDSSKMVDAVNNKIFADEIITPQLVAATTLNINAGGDIAVSTVSDIYLNATTGSINATTPLFDITGPLTVSGTITGNVTGNLTGYQTGDMTGSVFSDNSTLLVDGTNSVLRGTHIGDVIGSVFADNSTMLVNGVDGTLTYDAADPADWNGTAPTTVGEAIDRLATLVKALNAGTGA